jgi:CRISPR-associated protein Cas2
MLYVVAYDIPDDRRRLRVATLLLDYGARVQESVFECLLRNPGKLAQMKDRLKKVVDPDEDAVRIVPVCAGCAEGLIILGRGERTVEQDVYIL